MAADARLIAKSPELLAMNTELAEALGDMASSFPVRTQTDAVLYEHVVKLLKRSQKLLAEVESGS